MSNEAAAGYTNLILDSHYWTCTALNSVLETVHVRSEGCWLALSRQKTSWPDGDLADSIMSKYTHAWDWIERVGIRSSNSNFPVSASVCLNPELTNILQKELITSSTYVSHPLLSIAASGRVWTVTKMTFTWICVVTTCLPFGFFYLLFFVMTDVELKCVIFLSFLFILVSS